jgi:hypothetical protein
LIFSWLNTKEDVMISVVKHRIKCLTLYLFYIMSLYINLGLLLRMKRHMKTQENSLSKSISCILLVLKVNLSSQWYFEQRDLWYYGCSHKMCPFTFILYLHTSQMNCLALFATRFIQFSGVRSVFKSWDFKISVVRNTCPTFHSWKPFVTILSLIPRIECNKRSLRGVKTEKRVKFPLTNVIWLL